MIAATGLVILLKLDSNHRFFSHVILKFEWWPRKIKVHLFYITSSFVHHLKPLCAIELQLLSGNAHFVSNSAMIFAPCNLEIQWMTLKTIGILIYVTLSFVHHFKAIGEFKLKLQSGNAQFGSKSAILLSRMTLKFDEWPWKTIGHIFYATSSFMHHFEANGEFKLELQSGNAQSTIFRAVWPWNFTYDLDLLHEHHFCHW